MDVSDETVGTTTQNIPASAIQEFQLSQSSLDLSTELTSSGAVNVTTRSGSNQLHGEAFGYFRDNKLAAALPGLTPPPFQREQFGANLGGAIIKDKAFFFLDAERTKQDLTAAEPFSPPFDQLGTTLSQPYRDFDTDGRLDWNVKGNTRAFYRFNFFQNSDLRPFGAASSTQRFRNTNHTASHTLGIDFNKGAYSHSVRFEYLKFRNAIGDATSGLSSLDNPIPGLGINIGASVSGNCVFTGGGAYCGGPNWLAPQQTIQSDHEAKYDGSRGHGEAHHPLRRHIQSHCGRSVGSLLDVSAGRYDLCRNFCRPNFLYRRLCGARATESGSPPQKVRLGSPLGNWVRTTAFSCTLEIVGRSSRD